ncbi:MAG: metallophosphoesterase family protein [Bacillota bacterium]
MKFLHLADIHLGVETHGRLDPTTGLNTRLQDFSRSLGVAIDTAIAEDVDLVVFPGDAYRSCDPSPTHQRELARHVRRLADASIPLVMVVGNHDNPVSFGRSSAIEIFGTLAVEGVIIASKPQVIAVKTKSGPVQVACVPWPTRSLLLTKDEYRSLSDSELTARISTICTERIAELAAQVNPNSPAILAGHLAAAEAIYSGSERSALIGSEPVLLTSVLANPAFDYVALGHIHRFQDLNPKAAPPVVYSGSLERVNFGEEREEKGFVLAEILPKERAAASGGRPWASSYRFVRTPARKFLTIEVQIEPGDDPTERILRAIGRYQLDEAVVRLHYSIPEEMAHLVDLKAVQAALKPAQTVAGIVRQMQMREERRRVQLSAEAGLSQAFDRYLEARPDLKAMGGALKEKALMIERELKEAMRS